MKNNVISVSICISAFNEGKSIERILSQIVSQKQNKWIFKEILVYCDGCSDDTVINAKKIINRYIKILNFKKRMGKVFRVNQMLSESKGEILIIFDADLDLKDENVISSLVSKFENEKVMLVGGNTMPYLPVTFFEKAVYSTFLVFYESRRILKNGNNIFGCNGGCMAIRSKFAKEIKIPNVINEDDYIYFSCLKNRYLFLHANKAIVYYRLPKSLRDYLKQTFRSDPNAIKVNFTSYFGDLVKREYQRSIIFYSSIIIKVLLKNPIGTTYIILINILCKPFFPIISRKYKLEWYTANSTK